MKAFIIILVLCALKESYSASLTCNEICIFKNYLAGKINTETFECECTNNLDKIKTNVQNSLQGDAEETDNELNEIMKILDGLMSNILQEDSDSDQSEIDSDESNEKDVAEENEKENLLTKVAQKEEIQPKECKDKICLQQCVILNGCKSGACINGMCYCSGC